MILNELTDRLFEFFARPANSRQMSQVYADVALGTVKGVHRDENQDRCAFVEVHFPDDGRLPIRLGVICDGMGGLENGAIAASIALSSFIASLVLDGDLSYGHSLEQAISSANNDVAAKLEGKGGTTLTALLVDGAGAAWMAHAGDSRLYRIEPNREAVLCSYDDTVSGAVRAHQGEHNEDDLDNQLLQYIGIGGDLEPHIERLEKQADTRWLLTTDGAHSIGKQNLGTVIRTSASHLDFIRKVLFMSEALDARDNASAIFMNGFDSFPASKSFKGFNLLIVTPSERMEVWITNGPIGQSKKKSNNPVAKRSKSKVAKKQKEKTIPEKADDGSPKNRKKNSPQLDISFSNDGPTDDN